MGGEERPNAQNVSQDVRSLNIKTKLLQNKLHDDIRNCTGTKL
jgi:hypothetical protein